MIVIAENINVMSKSLGPAMKERNAEPIIKMAKTLEANGADILDLNVGFARKGGPELMEWIVKTVQSAVNIPLSLDTMNMEAMEAALKAYDPTPGPALINSISAIPERMEKMLPLAAQYKARFVALMYATDGIPRDSNERGALAAELLYHGMEAGLAVEDMFFDPVVVPVSSQQEQVVSCTEFTAMIGEDRSRLQQHLRTVQCVQRFARAFARHHQPDLPHHLEKPRHDFGDHGWSGQRDQSPLPRGSVPNWKRWL